MSVLAAKKVFSLSNSGQVLARSIHARMNYTEKYTERVCGALVQLPALHPQILLSSPFTFLFRCAFLRSVFPCCTDKAMSSADEIVRLLNDGGVDSATLAEVMTEYFCDDNDDAG